MLHEGKEIEGIHLKTVCLRGQVSQGLILPLSSFSNINEIGVLKYEAPIPACISGDVKGDFPNFIPKTDEERIQNFTEVLDIYKNQSFYITEKLDGTSTTIYKYNNEFGVCSKNLELKDTENNTMWQLAKQYKLPDNLPNGFAIQAETIGLGIQKNPLKLTGQDFYVFYVFDINKSQYLSLENMIHFVKNLGLKTVPIVNSNFVMNHTLDELLTMANEKSLLNNFTTREGIVFKLNSSAWKKLSFKVISNEYLLQ